jgi:ABC-type glycerol-3-phosphate transport system substrate-binding protein
LIESVFDKSRNKALAIDFLDWFANSPEAALILKTARGVLPSSIQREAVLANPTALSDIDKKMRLFQNFSFWNSFLPLEKIA